jgi:DNA replication protein DnaC
MTEETQQLLENLRLKKMATILDQELENAKNNSPSYSEFLLRLLQAQWHERQEKCLQYRIQQARLPEQWTLESCAFKKPPGG